MNEKRTIKISVTEQQYEELKQLQRALGITGIQLIQPGLTKWRREYNKQQQQSRKGTEQK